MGLHQEVCSGRAAEVEVQALQGGWSRRRQPVDVTLRLSAAAWTSRGESALVGNRNRVPTPAVLGRSDPVATCRASSGSSKPGILCTTGWRRSLVSLRGWRVHAERALVDLPQPFWATRRR